MNPLTITFPGDVPSKKNSKQIIYRYGKPIIISSSKFSAWEKVALKELVAQYRGESIPKVSNITMTFYPSTKRKSDLSNKWEGVADVLVKGGMLEDDNWFVVSYAVMKFGEVDKTNPRVVVEIFT